MKALFSGFCIPSPSADENSTRFQLHLQYGISATNPASLLPGILPQVNSAKAIQSSQPGLKIADQS